jgi:hypothetical protein
MLCIAGLCQARTPDATLGAVECPGWYDYHLQGVAITAEHDIVWSFTNALVKTDAKGRISKKVSVPFHQGDLCYRKGKLYVAVNLGPFNSRKQNADSWLYVYDAEDLSLLKKHELPRMVYGAGGVAHHDGRFLVVGGLPKEAMANLVYEYDANWQFQTRHELAGGYTLKGIQTATFADGHWWFGCYGQPRILLKADAALDEVERFEFDCALGIVPAGAGRFLIGRGQCAEGKGCRGELELARPDTATGLRLIE